MARREETIEELYERLCYWLLYAYKMLMLFIEGMIGISLIVQRSLVKKE